LQRLFVYLLRQVVVTVNWKIVFSHFPPSSNTVATGACGFATAMIQANEFTVGEKNLVRRVSVGDFFRKSTD